MVHVPPTVRTPGRRGRPPKHRDPVIAAPAEDGSAPKATFISSLSFKGDLPSTSSHSPSPLPTPIHNSTELSGAGSSLQASSQAKALEAAPSTAPSTSASNGNLEQNSISETPNTRGRAPRKSKIDAMAALTARSVSPSDGTRGSSAATPQSNGGGGPRSNAATSKPPAKPQPTVPEAPPVDFSYIKMPNRTVDPPRTTPRPFELEDCPAYYPTAEEWKDPMAYVKSISDTARQYGICKVVPPEGWRMPFVIDTKTFHFKTRLQRLNSIEASSRAKINFLEQLYRFHQQQEAAGPVVPTINHKPLDLWLLRKEVHSRGGFDIVSRTKHWGEIARVLGYEGMVGVSTQLKNAYIRIILPFEQFSEHIRNSPSMSALSPEIRYPLTSPGAATRMGSRMGAANQPPTRMSRMRANASPSNGTPNGKPGAPLALSRTSTPLSLASSGLSEPPEEEKPNIRTGIKIEVTPAEDGDVAMNGATTSSTPLPRILSEREKPSDYVQGDSCEVCNSGEKGTQMLLCDGCDKGYHTFCLDPPLSYVPKGQWFCHICLFDTGGDYGFDEGEDHSLHSFQGRDLAFRKAWFEAHPPAPPPEGHNDLHRYKIGDIELGEDDVEREFWRLVESPLETVEIEYGADVHSTTHGSASPSLETHPLNPYSKDGWNMNNMPIVSDSLLRYVKSDISGMTVPWVYVGMIFSTFCWHNEDHYTYSVNYMHWGETKTWYGIPGDDAEKFEAAIKSEAPDLFEAQPDLLFQLVTLMSPKRLKDAGVRVYGCNQRPGEYVITFPKAYHAGFNHGLNLNEAVNFAVPDWLNDGRDCVRRYQEHKKLPVFSHEELLITITQHSTSIKTATWLLDSLHEMIDGHLSLREKLRQAVPNIPELTEEHDVPEDQYQCAVCKGFSYLAQITCQCTKQVACLEHWTELCECPHRNRTLRKRFDDDQLLAILDKVRDRSTGPIAWRHKLKSTLSGPEKPELPALRSLANDAAAMEVTLPEFPNLRKFVDKADHIVERTQTITGSRPLPIFRKHLPRRPGSEIQVRYAGDYDAQDVADLLREADELWFDCFEMRDLLSLDRWAAAWDQRATTMLTEQHQAGPNAPLDRDAWDTLFLESFNHNYRLNKFDDVARVVKRIRLLEELRDVQDSALTMEDVEELQKQAVNCSLPPENTQAIKLKELAERGTQWCKYAHMVLEQPVIGLEDLNKLVAPPCSVPVFPSLLERIDSVRARAREIEKQAKGILYPSVGRRTPIADAQTLVVAAQKEFIIPAVQILADVVPVASDIEKTCRDVLNVAYMPTSAQHKPLFERLRDIRTTVQKKLWMFQLPNFDIIDQQLVQHDAWLEKLPWYRTPEPAMQGKLIVDDVVQNTRPDDDKPPVDPECTCICLLPVKVTVEKQADAVQCDHCGAKFHSKCIEGSCPFCDHHHWNGTLPKARSFDFANLIPIAKSAPNLTRNYSLAWKHLDIIITYMDRFNMALDFFLAKQNEKTMASPPPTAVPQIRHFMRKLYKIQFSVQPRIESPSYGLTLCHLHRIMANNKAAQEANQKRKAQRRPKFTFTAEIFPPASDGSRCLCKGSHVGHRLITCNSCSYNFHGYCVRYDDVKNPAPKPWRCPMCMIRKGKQYPQSAVRVKTVAEQEQDVYVDTKACLENFSWQLIRQRLPPPTDYTIILELERFVPGSNQSAESSLAAKPPAPPPAQPSAGASNSVSREPSRTPTSASTSQGASTTGSSNGTSRAIMPSPAIVASNGVTKRKAPTSPAAENPRRVKLLFREGDKATEEGSSRPPS